MRAGARQPVALRGLPWTPSEQVPSDIGCWLITRLVGVFTAGIWILSGFLAQRAHVTFACVHHWPTSRDIAARIGGGEGRVGYYDCGSWATRTAPLKSPSIEPMRAAETPSAPPRPPLKPLFCRGLGRRISGCWYSLMVQGSLGSECSNSACQREGLKVHTFRHRFSRTAASGEVELRRPVVPRITVPADRDAAAA
jgi:hypothetical protein